MTDTDKWKKRFVRELSPQHKLLWFYILDDCNHAGIWEVDIEVASIRVGYELVYDMLPQPFLDKIEIFDNGDQGSTQNFAADVVSIVVWPGEPFREKLQDVRKYALFRNRHVLLFQEC